GPSAIAPPGGNWRGISLVFNQEPSLLNQHPGANPGTSHGAAPNLEHPLGLDGAPTLAPGTVVAEEAPRSTVTSLEQHRRPLGGLWGRVEDERVSRAAGGPVRGQSGLVAGAGTEARVGVEAG
ncbi:unnamed protein product, partial [Discosporangium mesarthrocarpum]